MNKLRLVVAFFFISITANAQNAVEMADLMRSNGKIYTVVAVCLTILIGLFIYVFSIEKKLTRLEKEHNNK